MEDGYFGESVAASYDESSAAMFTPPALDPAVDVLEELAGHGRALEFAVGTGRLAVPLAQRGVPVHGIDISRAMVKRLHAKTQEIAVTIGDIATTTVDGSFSVVYLVFNTINNLTTQAAQVACFRNAAAHLGPGGSFVIEVGVPPLRLLPPGQSVVPFANDEHGWAYDLIDTSTQAMSSNYVDTEHGLRSVPFRYVWPAELDLMAQMAGLGLRHRWEDWSRKSFDHESRGHVSIWEKLGS